MDKPLRALPSLPETALAQKGTDEEAQPYDWIRQSFRDVEAMLREEFNYGESCESTRGEDARRKRRNLHSSISMQKTFDKKLTGYFKVS